MKNLLLILVVLFLSLPIQAGITYKIITKPTATELEREVNSNIRNGWVPIGGVSVAVNSTTSYWEYSQAMTLTKN